MVVTKGVRVEQGVRQGCKVHKQVRYLSSPLPIDAPKLCLQCRRPTFHLKHAHEQRPDFWLGEKNQG